MFSHLRNKRIFFARFLFNSLEMEESFGHMHHLDSEFVTIPETAYVLDTHGQFHFWIADIVLWKWEGAKTFGHVWWKLFLFCLDSDFGQIVG